MSIEMLPVGPLQANCYIIHDESGRDAIVVDPGDDADRIIKFLMNSELRAIQIVCTHGHFDHVGAVARVKEKTGAQVLIHRDDLPIYARAKEQAAAWGFAVESPPPPDGFLSEGDSVIIGALSYKVLHTPGHSPGGICLLGNAEIITGDTIFAGSVGRTDFPGGSIEALKQSFRRIMALPAETTILPGHGPASSVGEEHYGNFFMSEL